MILKEVKRHSQIRFKNSVEFGNIEYKFLGMGWGCSAMLINTLTGERSNHTSRVYYLEIDLISTQKLSDGQDAVLYRYELVNYFVEDEIMTIIEANRIVKINKFGREI